MHNLPLDPMQFVIHHPFIVAVSSWLVNTARMHYKAYQTKQLLRTVVTVPLPVQFHAEAVIKDNPSLFSKVNGQN